MLDKKYIAKESIKFTDYGPDSMMRRKLGKKYRRKLTYDEEQKVKELGEGIFYQQAIFKILDYLPQHDIMNTMRWLSRDMYNKFVPDYCAFNFRMKTMSCNEAFVMNPKWSKGYQLIEKDRDGNFQVFSFEYDWSKVMHIRGS